MTLPPLLIAMVMKYGAMAKKSTMFIGDIRKLFLFGEASSLIVYSVTEYNTDQQLIELKPGLWEFFI